MAVFTAPMPLPSGAMPGQPGTVVRRSERRGFVIFRRLMSWLPAKSDIFVVLFLNAMTVVVASFAAQAEDERIKARRGSEPVVFSDAEIADGFFKIAFGAELRVSGSGQHIRKFDGPVRVFLDNRAQANRRADIAAVISDIRVSVDRLDIAQTDDRAAANVVITLVRDRGELLRTMRSFYGRKRADEIERRLTPRCLTGISEDPEHRIRRAEVLLTADGGDFSFLDCAYEELLQALGPINDDRSVPWTMFNDDVQMGFFDVYDQYLLNILYDPRVRPGMTRQDVEKLLPDILPKIHGWIARVQTVRTFGHGADDPATAVTKGPPLLLATGNSHDQSPLQSDVLSGF